MDAREPRLTSPSLLDDGGDVGVGVPASTPFVARAPADRTAPAPVSRHRPPHWLLGAGLAAIALVAVGLLTLGGAFDGDGNRLPKAAAASNAEPARAAAVTVAPSMGRDVPPRTAAVILPAPETPGAASSAPASPAPVAVVDKEASKLSSVFNAGHKSAITAAPAPRARPRGKADGADSDVALLTALIKHVEVKGGVVGAPPATVKPVSIDARMHACPPANTEAGVQCRQKVCEGQAGKVAACPASVGGA